MLELRRSLKDRAAQLTLLTQRYDHMHARFESVRDAHEKARDMGWMRNSLAHALPALVKKPVTSSVHATSRLARLLLAGFITRAFVPVTSRMHVTSLLA